MGKIYTFNDKIVTINNKWAEEYVEPTPVDPYNPLGLPANTIRVKFKSGYTPTIGMSQTLVDSTNNVWDIYNLRSWNNMFMNCTDLLEVLGANTTDVTYMSYLFQSCSSLSTVPVFDTSNVTNISGMFQGCSSLTYVPLFDTSSVTDMSYMFFNCSNVEGGALALYQQASTQTSPPAYHDMTFKKCGSNTVTGAAELAQIPSDWK